MKKRFYYSQVRFYWEKFVLEVEFSTMIKKRVVDILFAVGFTEGFDFSEDLIRIGSFVLSYQVFCLINDNYIDVLSNLVNFV